MFIGGMGILGILILVGIAFLFKESFERKGEDKVKSQASAVEVLKKRYARGDIDRNEEFIIHERSKMNSVKAKLTRRNFVNYFLGGSLIGTILTFLYPVIRFIIPPKQAETLVNQVQAGVVGELAPNSYKIFKFGNSPGILIHTSEGELRAFTAICTHLNCTVRFDNETQTIHCPCHNGRFDLAGNVLSGPPPVPLEMYDVKTSEGNIFVSKRA